MQTIFLHCGVRAAEYLEKNLANCLLEFFVAFLFIIFQVLPLHLKVVALKRFFAFELFAERVMREVTSRDKSIYLRQGQTLKLSFKFFDFIGAGTDFANKLTSSWIRF